jgi:hypothetical protein
MAKKGEKARSWREELEDLSAEAGPLLPDGALEDELWDACEADARLAHEQICSEPLLNQLEFLYERGYDVGRLREIVRELKGQRDS